MLGNDCYHFKCSVSANNQNVFQNSSHPSPERKAAKYSRMVDVATGERPPRLLKYNSHCLKTVLLP